MSNLITIGYEDVPFNEDYDKVDRKLVRTAIQDALESFIISKETLLLHEAPVFHQNGQTVIARLDGKEMSCNISGIHIAGIIEDFLFLPEGHPEKGEVEVESDLRRSVVGDPLNIPEEYHWFDSMRMTSDGKLVYFWSDSPRSEISNTAVESVGEPISIQFLNHKDYANLDVRSALSQMTRKRIVKAITQKLRWTFKARAITSFGKRRGKVDIYFTPSGNYSVVSNHKVLLNYPIDLVNENILELIANIIYSQISFGSRTILADFGDAIKDGMGMEEW